MKLDNKQFLESFKKFRKKKKEAQAAIWRKHRDPGLFEYTRYLKSPFRIMYTNLLAGMARGLGFVLGATVIVAIVVYIVSKILVDIPVVGTFFEWLNQVLQENLDKTSTGYPKTQI